MTCITVGNWSITQRENGFGRMDEQWVHDINIFPEFDLYLEMVSVITNDGRNIVVSCDNYHALFIIIKWFQREIYKALIKL